jgi:ATP-dependent DNA helicase RecG
MELKLDSPVDAIPSVGKRIGQKLRAKGILTIEDLIYFTPRRYLDHSRLTSIGTLKPGETATCIGTIRSLNVKQSGSLKLTEAIIFDGSGYLYLVWFGDRKLEKILKEGDNIAVSGNASYYRGKLQMENPEFEVLGDQDKHTLLNTGRIVPVYPSINGLSSRQLRRIIYNALQSTFIPEILPAEIIVQEKLLPRQVALYELHFPSNQELAEKALRRLRFEELFILQVALADLKSRYQVPELGIAHCGNKEIIKEFFNLTGINPTPSQLEAIEEIIEDLQRDEPMNRLLQGEVGSGKTLVALAASIFVASGGYQVAFMAPTEILAEQQFTKFEKNLIRLGFNPLLLTGSVRGKKKDQLLELIANGKADIVFGTHSLIYEDVVFKNLGLVIIDEQHRFGTLQRLLLREKGKRAGYGCRRNNEKIRIIGFFS